MSRVSRQKHFVPVLQSKRNRSRRSVSRSKPGVVVTVEKVSNFEEEPISRPLLQFQPLKKPLVFLQCKDRVFIESELNTPSPAKPPIPSVIEKFDCSILSIGSAPTTEDDSIDRSVKLIQNAYRTFVFSLHFKRIRALFKGWQLRKLLRTSHIQAHIKNIKDLQRVIDKNPRQNSLKRHLATLKLQFISEVHGNKIRLKDRRRSDSQRKPMDRPSKQDDACRNSKEDSLLLPLGSNKRRSFKSTVPQSIESSALIYNLQVSMFTSDSENQHHELINRKKF